MHDHPRSDVVEPNEKQHSQLTESRRSRSRSSNSGPGGTETRTPTRSYTWTLDHHAIGRPCRRRTRRIHTTTPTSRMTDGPRCHVSVWYPAGLLLMLLLLLMLSSQSRRDGGALEGPASSSIVLQLCLADSAAAAVWPLYAIHPGVSA